MSQLAEALRKLEIAAVYSSPLERAVETATPLAAARGLPVVRSAELLEVDFGEWTGRAIADLEQDDRWRSFNARRSSTRIPGGERIDEVVGRGERALLAAHREHPGATVALVTHGDVIRGLLAHVLGMPLDHMLRLEVGTASVSAVELGDGWSRVVGVNWRPGGLGG